MALPFVCAWALAGVAAGLSCALATGICSPAAIATAHKPTPKARPRVFVRGSRIVDSPNHPSTSAIAEATAFLRCFETMSGGCSRQFVREHPVGDIVSLALGHDGLWILADWILADRILADRSFANRRRRRRRLLTRQVGGGGSAQHGQGCSRSEYNALHHDLFPLCLDSIAFRKPRRRSNRRGTPPSSHHHLARAVSTAARLTML